MRYGTALQWRKKQTAKLTVRVGDKLTVASFRTWRGWACDDRTGLGRFFA